MRKQQRAPRRRNRATVSSVLGELLVTLGVVLLMFLGWKYYLYDSIIGNEEIAASSELSAELAQQYETLAPAEPDLGGIPIRPLPTAPYEEFGVLYVPSWSPDFSRRIATDIDRTEVLDPGYIGAYMDSGPVGAEGNFILAAHRTASGAPFIGLPKLELGNKVYIETVDGWYVYAFRSSEYVSADQVDVLANVPRHPELPKNERFLVLLTCNPEWSIAERLVSYLILEDFVPRSDGPPQEIAAAVQARIDSGGEDAGRGD